MKNIHHRVFVSNFALEINILNKYVMMKAFLLAAVLSLFTQNISDDNPTVYISTGKAAYAYHARQSCKTLKRCVEEGHVRAVTMEEAKGMGRRPCKVCYR